VLTRRSVVPALCVLVVGFVAIWLGLVPNGDPLEFCPDAPQAEGTSLRAEPALWPPGTTRCDYGGSSRTYVPLQEWLALALFAGAVASVPRRLELAAVLLLAAFAVFFVV
jgi:hypothetical protein